MVITTEEFIAQIGKAKIGSRITLCRLDEKILGRTDGWYGHPKGIVLRQGRFVLLNEEDWGTRGRNVLLSEEPDRLCFSSPDGVVIMSSDGTLRLDGDKIINEAQAHAHFQVPSSVVRTGGKIFLAGDGEYGGIEITEGPWDGWDFHPYGVMFRWGGEVTLVVTAPPKAS